MNHRRTARAARWPNTWVAVVKGFSVWTCPKCASNGVFAPKFVQSQGVVFGPGFSDVYWCWREGSFSAGFRQVVRLGGGAKGLNAEGGPMSDYYRGANGCTGVCTHGCAGVALRWQWGPSSFDLTRLPKLQLTDAQPIQKKQPNRTDSQPTQDSLPIRNRSQHPPKGSIVWFQWCFLCWFCWVLAVRLFRFSCSVV